MTQAVSRWLFAPVPRGRVAVFRAIVYLFVAADLVVFTPWVRAHGSVDGELYQPLWIARVLHLPTPTSLVVQGIFWTLLVTALIAATGKAPRLLGWIVFALYFEWMIIAMSYGKVDHDRFAFLVALAVLPTCGVARWRDRSPSESAGWALRVVQIAVIATYFLAAWSKLRFGGLDWMTGSVLARAILRRGTDLADLIAPVPGLLIAAQIGIMSFELLSPLIFVLPERWRKWAVAYFYSFHAVTIATITISFAPHLVAMLGFLPLERAADRVFRRRPIATPLPSAAPLAGSPPLAAPVATPSPVPAPQIGVAAAGSLADALTGSPAVAMPPPAVAMPPAVEPGALAGSDSAILAAMANRDAAATLRRGPETGPGVASPDAVAPSPAAGDPAGDPA